jgi:hypothetical protein
MEEDDKHPSGMSLARWNWPFKTPEEQQLAAKWFAQEARRQRKQQLNDSEPAPY